MSIKSLAQSHEEQEAQIAASEERIATMTEATERAGYSAIPSTPIVLEASK